jgi:hypothetical protein
VHPGRFDLPKARTVVRAFAFIAGSMVTMRPSRARIPRRLPPI